MTLLPRSPIGVETLDAADVDPAVARATLRDLAVVNTLCGGRRAVAVAFRRLLRRHPDRSSVRVLDVGAGAGDILAHLVTVGARLGVRVQPVAVDVLPAAAQLCREANLATVVADAARLPIARRGVDIVVVSQLLHHLDRQAAVTLVRALDRIARLGLIVADLRRSFAARVGVRLFSAAMRFHPVTGRDGAVSVRRGFTAGELRDLCSRAEVDATVRRRAGFRLVAVAEGSRAHD